MTTMALNKELEAYEAHRNELLGKAEGKYVLIHDGDVIDIFDSQMDAINHGYQRFGNVPFLVKQVLAVEPTVNFASHLLAV